MPSTITTLAMIFLVAAAASADVINADVDAIIPEGKVAVEEQFIETAASEADRRVTPTEIDEFNSNVESADQALEDVIAQTKQETALANAQRKKAEWDAARFKANTRTTLRSFPMEEDFPVLVESTFPTCVYKPKGFGLPIPHTPAAPAVHHAYAKHYKHLCTGEIAMKQQKKEAAEKSIELKDKKCADTAEKSNKSAEAATKSFKKTQVNEKSTKEDAEKVKELKTKLSEVKNKKDAGPPPAAPAPAKPESPELCEKQGFAKEKYEKHSEKLTKVEDLKKKADSAKESAEKAQEAKYKQEIKYKEVAKKKTIESANKKSEKDEKCAKNADVKEAATKGAESGSKGDVKEELEKAKHMEVTTKDEAESHGKEKAQKSAEAVSKTAMYEKKIKKELHDKKTKHDKVLELQEKALEIKKKHPKKPDMSEELEKTKEKTFKTKSTSNEKDSKFEIQKKKSSADSDEMKEKNESFDKAEKKTKGSEVECKGRSAEMSAKNEKKVKEGAMKLDSKSKEGDMKVTAVTKKEKKSKEKHAKDPFYHLAYFAKKVTNMKEVFTKTKAAYERKCKMKEMEVQTKADYKLKTEEAIQESEVKATAKTTKELESKTEVATKEKVKKVEGAAENLEKATNERCDKTTVASEKSDKFEVKTWSSKLDDFKSQCKEAEKHEERDQKTFVVSICAAAHHQMMTAASGISLEIEDDTSPDYGELTETPTKAQLEKAIAETEGAEHAQLKEDKEPPATPIMPPPMQKGSQLVPDAAKPSTAK